MSMTDPIADFLTRIRNAIMARHTEVVIPFSGIKQGLAEIMKQEGYVDAVQVRTTLAGPKEIVVKLRWADPLTNAITGLHRKSKPGQRVYVRSKSIPKVRSGLGVSILSTSSGLMTDSKARQTGVGGEIVCEVW